ncbi:MAG: MFS transporter [Paracraurococcus sp.]
MIARSSTANRSPAAARAIFHQLLAAHAFALVSTGVATVALALLAYDLAGVEAGAVLGTALGIKMLGYVLVTPVASAFAERLPRRATLVFLDVVRAGVVLALPFVTRIVEIYVLIFIFQAASATFTTTLQATVPELFEERREYARALSLTRLAVELENLVSPLLAAVLLLVLSFRGLFVLTVAGFLLSAAIILLAALPAARDRIPTEIGTRVTGGFRKLLDTPRLRALIALNLAASAAAAMVIVNTVVYVQANLGLTATATAAALAVYGAGSVAGALLVPRLMALTSDRSAMLAGAALAAIGLVGGVSVSAYFALLPLWFALGFGAALAQTPAGVLICRSCAEDDRQSLYAAQFAISSACLLLTYPLAGWLGAETGMEAAFLVLGAVAALSVGTAARLWPYDDRAALEA